MPGTYREDRDGAAVFAPTGRIDSETSPALERELLEAVENGTTNLVLDFAGVEYISSAGLRVLLVLHKALEGKGEMVVRNVNSLVMELFEDTGVSEILTIE